MGALLELLFELFGELILQVLGEALVELGLHGLAAPLRKMPNPYLATIGYVLFGAIAGAISLWIFPSLFIASPAGRIVNAVVTPLVAGGAMVALGAWRLKRGQQLVLIDRFAYGYLFALVMALVRLRFGS